MPLPTPPLSDPNSSVEENIFTKGKDEGMRDGSVQTVWAPAQGKQFLQDVGQKILTGRG